MKNFFNYFESKMILVNILQFAEIIVDQKCFWNYDIGE